jgi:6-phosphofructokinase 2
MPNIATLTMNPSIDAAYDVEVVRPMRKMRSTGERYDPGGGGINVARVLARFGVPVRAYYLSGGATGAALDALLNQHMLARTRVPISGNTRFSSAVFERSTGQEYRFVPKGPTIVASELRACLDRLEDAKFDYLVASGSLPLGVPEDFYAQVGAIAARKGATFILDSSGPALAKGLAGGTVWLAKPSRGELQQLVGQPLGSLAELSAAALGLVADKQAQHVAVTLGREGAILATASGVCHLPAVDVPARSAVGAGDSFLGAMVFALSQNWPISEAFRFALAAGAAAVLNPGTNLCEPKEVERLFKEVAPLSEKIAA